MGEAKRRKASQDAWYNSLSDSQRIIASTALSTYEQIVVRLGMTGGCYRMTFFMATYLRLIHGITVEPIVGFINDGTDDLMMSHAWIEFGGQKTDLTLVRTEMQPPGPLIVLDREILKGEINYSYHRSESDVSRRQKVELARPPHFNASVGGKDVEHAEMLELAKHPEKQREYLDAAPDGYDFEAFSHLIG